MASPVGYPNIENSAVYPYSYAAGLKTQSPSNGKSGAPPLTALSIEFVAKPREAHRVEAAIPAAVAGALRDVTGFAGCLVMISDQEARLVTVVTLWAGHDRTKCCNQNVRWVNALLAPYLDRRLRTQTMVAHLPVLPMDQTENVAASESAAMQNIESEDETVCVA
ncbi:MAG TPA: hypothetical protein VEW05_09135 [Candidatus Polarisedimenticolia bacterium]|nr:hypothetical protein [Candidatus Polarisedimenticolia bacterium]